MWVMSGRSHDPKYSIIVQEAILCKLFGCTPSQLRKENYEDVVNFSYVLNHLAKKNPMALFM